MTDLQRRSALGGDHVFSTRDFSLRELEVVAKLRVQALRSRGLRTAAADATKLPHSPNTVAGSDPFALWKAPDDWLVYSPSLGVSALYDWLASVESAAPLIVTDVSSATAVFELSGRRAVEILMRDCTLDLEGGAVPAGGLVQTQFAHTVVMIHRPTNENWHLFVERSVCLHVWEWLADTAGSPLTPSS